MSIANSTWSAKVLSIRDVGNGTGDVTVEFRRDDAVLKSKTYNFTAGQVTLESAKAEISNDLLSLVKFAKLGDQAQELIGVVITIDPEIVKKIDEAV